MSNYTIDRQARTCHVKLAGDLTASLVPELQEQLKRELGQPTEEVIFDLGATKMLDSSGIGLLIAACNSLSRQSGRLRVIRVSPDILQLLKSMRLVARLGVTSA